jgi:hypothetical protein
MNQARLIRIAVAASALLVAVSACGNDNAPTAPIDTTQATASTAVDPPTADVFFPTMTEPKDSWPAALLVGPLTEVDGCLMVGDPATGQFLALWPHGYRAVVLEGNVVVVNEEGTKVVAVGDEADFGGGQIPPDLATDLAGTPIPERCLTEFIWSTAPATLGG